LHYMGTSVEALEALPPLPVPNIREQRVQALGGCVTVIGTVCFFVAGTHAALALAENLPHGFVIISLVSIYSEAVTALLCLTKILFGDPGVVRRTLTTCFPQPPVVAEKLAAGQCLSSLRNIENESGQRSFCVRCLVWRESQFQPSSCGTLFTKKKKKSKAHHCRICERCVSQFDHHCGVFGRCIAGSGLVGNMAAFVLIISMGICGGLTFLVTAAVALAYSWDDIRLSQALKITIVSLIALCCCFQVSGYCVPLRRCIIRLIMRLCQRRQTVLPRRQPVIETIGAPMSE